MDSTAYAISRHEALHAVAAHLLGWRVTGVHRRRHGDFTGATHYDTPPDVAANTKQRGEEFGIILMCPMIVDPDGCSADLAKLSELVQSGISFGTVSRRAHALVMQPDFRRKRRLVEDALLRRPTLDEEAVRKLLQ